MENPVSDIPRIIKLLCTAPPDVQRAAVETYFTPTASFTHPFCRTGSFSGSIWLIATIYRWYKILSPHIDVEIDSVAFDEPHMRLYVSLHQNFKVWVVPFYNAPVRLVTVLQLTTDPLMTHAEHQRTLEGGNGKEKRPMLADNELNTRSNGQKSSDSTENTRYWIQSQNDLYQTTEWIKFLLPWGIGVLLMVVWQFYATFLCVVGTKVYDMLVWAPNELYRQHYEVFDNNEEEHPHLGAD